MFSAIRNVKFNAQIGPHETFAELQAAAAREIPGAVLTGPPNANTTQGKCKGADGGDLGLWTGPPFVLTHPVSLTTYTGPFETLDELQIAVSHDIPSAVLVPPAKGSSGHAGEIRDSAGRNAGQWIEVTGK